MADTIAPPDTVAAPATPQVQPTITVGWAQPTSTSAARKEPAQRPAKKRGLPAGPALASLGNATALTMTSIYEAGGVPAVLGAGGALLVGSAGAVAARRRTVKQRRASVAAGRSGSWGSGSGGRGSSAGSGFRFQSGSGAGSRPGSGSGSRGSSSGSAGGSSWFAGSGSGSSDTRNQAGSNRSAGAAGTSSQRSAAAGTGTSAGSRLSRTADRQSGGTGKTNPNHGSKKDRAKNHGKPSKAARLATIARRTGKGAAAVTGKAWKATSPHRSAALITSRRARRKLREGSADALKSLRAGVWGVIRHWSFKKGAQRAAAAWRKHRAARTEAAKPIETEAAKPERTIASVVRKPVTPHTTGSPNGGTRMPGHHFTGPAMEMARAAAAYEPQGMLQVGADFAGLKEALELVAESMKITVENADAKQPLHPQIVEIMRNIHSLQLKASELANELEPAFRNLHQVDLARLENPRKGIQGERMWDVSTNLQ